MSAASNSPPCGRGGALQKWYGSWNALSPGETSMMCICDRSFTCICTTPFPIIRTNIPCLTGIKLLLHIFQDAIFRESCPKMLPQESSWRRISGPYLLLVYRHRTLLSSAPTIEPFTPEVEPADLMWSISSLTNAWWSLEHARSIAPRLCTHARLHSHLPSQILSSILYQRSPPFPRLKGDFVQSLASCCDWAATSSWWIAHWERGWGGGNFHCIM